ncbi:hypothetical protein ACIBEA_34140 [Streptomyces sp. NPDC051555]|uniref:hypothetical protein n=1 Tax=Streptomyces sp. NPDC051555 TaxID=3365657 RepID=UPI0037AB2B34
MFNRKGTAAAPTSGLQLPALSYATHARTTYRSSVCAIGTHHECAYASPTTAPIGIPVTYEACDCTCHEPGTQPEPQQVNQ